MRVTASAPGKLVLSGDHAAVYGKPCIVTAVNIRYSVTAQLTAEPMIHIDTPELRQQGGLYSVPPSHVSASNRPETAFVEAALVQVLLRRPLKDGLRVTTAGPARSFGLGSSSAITVATIAAVAELLEINHQPRDLFDMAYTAVLDVQGKGSGIDVAAAVYGGTVYYITGDTVTDASIEPINIPSLPLVIGYSGDKVSTTSLISHVAGLRTKYRAFIEPILHMMGEISTAARDDMIAGNWQNVGELMNIHQGLLDSLGVSVPQLANPIFAARGAGAWGAKLSGAGGGDCMFALVDPALQHNVEQAIESANGEIVHLEPNAPGVEVTHD